MTCTSLDSAEGGNQTIMIVIDDEDDGEKGLNVEMVPFLPRRNSYQRYLGSGEVVGSIPDPQT